MTHDPAEPGPAPHIERGLPVPMRDGVILRADLWTSAQGEPRPALLCRTPYGKAADETEQRLAAKAVARGYAVLLQDVRGRNASEGLFEPHAHEGRDGFDTIEWAAAQPWCDGRVGTFGLSYPGSAQWLAAVEAPPHLLALAPAMGYGRLREAVRYHGVFDADWLRWAWLYMAPDTRRRLGLPGPKSVSEAFDAWERQGLEETFAGLPLGDFGDLREAAPYVLQWLAQPHASPWWAFGDIVDRLDRVTAAVLHLDGWLNDACGPRGAVACHGALSAMRSPARSRLVLGPWSHGVPAVTGDWREGGRDFGPDAFLDYDALVLGFMDEHVRGLPGGQGRAAPVRFFVMGENRWREADVWPLPDLGELALHFGPDGALAPEAPPQQGENAFDSDPARPVHALPSRASAPAEQAGFLAAHAGRLLLFETAPLAETLTLAGELRAELFVSADAPDADLFLILQDVAPDGTACLLMDPRAGALRLSQADGEDPRPLATGEIRQVGLDGMWTANAFLPGHRLRAILCGSWHPVMGRNPQTGASETASAETRPARITLHHGPGTASRIILPVAHHAPPQGGKEHA